MMAFNHVWSSQLVYSPYSLHMKCTDSISCKGLDGAKTVQLTSWQQPQIPWLSSSIIRCFNVTDETNFAFVEECIWLKHVWQLEVPYIIPYVKAIDITIIGGTQSYHSGPVKWINLAKIKSHVFGCSPFLPITRYPNDSTFSLMR